LVSAVSPESLSAAIENPRLVYALIVVMAAQTQNATVISTAGSSLVGIAFHRTRAQAVVSQIGLTAIARA